MEHNPFPFASLDDVDLTNFLNSNTVVHNFSLSVINTMMYNPFNYFENISHVSDNLSIQCNINEPSCDYVFNESVKT